MPVWITRIRYPAGATGMKRKAVGGGEGMGVKFAVTDASPDSVMQFDASSGVPTTR